MPPSATPHMTPEEFRRYGYAVVDWLANYQRRVESFPVLSQAAPNSTRALLPAEAPQQGEPFELILADVERIILPGLTHWQSPNFFAYFPANSSGPSVLGDLLSSGLGIQGMLWATSPAATELETHVLDWLVDMLDLPRGFLSSGSGGGVIQDSASSAALCAILAARERATEGATNRSGVNQQQQLLAYCSSQAHSSIEKGLRVAGIGSANLRLVEVDETFALRPDALRAQMEEDRRGGATPFFVAATAGTTSSNAMDPLDRIGRVCNEFGAWLHVDAAMSGTAALCPELRFIHKGLDYADSYCFDPHKWMFTNFDCTAFYVRERQRLISALTIIPEYLRNQASESGAVWDYRDWHVPLGRRFRALKLWFVIRHFGVEGLRQYVRRHVAWGRQFAGWVRDDRHFQLMAPAPLNLVCFRHVGPDDFNAELLRRINQTGRAYLTHTRLSGAFTLRFCVGQTNTELRHVEAAWLLIQQTAAQMRLEAAGHNSPI